jgi:MazG family protein
VSQSQSDGTLDRALELVRFLRKNCPWDAAQTPESLVPYLLEESHETADAISAGDKAHLAGELGDLLLNVAFQIVIAEESGAFNAETVVANLESKMRRRHPHLYGDGPELSWEEIKRRERLGGQADGRSGGQADGRSGGQAFLLSDIPSLDPLSKAHRIQERVASVGFDWADASGAFDKVAEELREVGDEMNGASREALEEELGDLLFAVVNLVRLLNVHSVTALQKANAKFTRRFDALERLASERGVVLGSASLEELDALWNEVKALGKS